MSDRAMCGAQARLVFAITAALGVRTTFFQFWRWLDCEVVKVPMRNGQPLPADEADPGDATIQACTRFLACMHAVCTAADRFAPCMHAVVLHPLPAPCMRMYCCRQAATAGAEACM